MSVRSGFLIALFIISLVVISGCLSQADKGSENYGNVPDVNEYYDADFIYVDSEVQTVTPATPDEIKTPSPAPTNPYRTEVKEIIYQDGKLPALIKSSGENICQLREKLNFEFRYKAGVERLMSDAEEIRDVGIEERKKLMRLNVSEEYLVSQLKCRCFLDKYIQTSISIISYCDRMIETETYGSKTLYEKSVRDFVEKRNNEFDEAEKYLEESKAIINKISG
ncbi:hypothetical protein F1737_06960 [Methanoplanus sp. FWC-SCC4]|uniref:Uncharacterized protein n=1 Tax=Methanochimaera problematica TaxID=2609417 RepID=A0AA97FDV0_9EURY|nr:hypothetical protein [Methanoplanus sp. FWC-SCC4]WOF16458.1 hypothetical protein F1737_06960 [Methanoplanus sp. FWC-SCC4]